MTTETRHDKLVRLFLEKGVDLSAEELEALARCFGKRGKYAGYLTNQAPNSRKFPLANAIWNAIQPNPFKTQMANIMFMPEEVRGTYEKLAKWNYPSWLDLDKERLQEWGAW